MSSEVDILVLKQLIRVAGMMVATRRVVGEMKTAENRETQQSIEMRGEVVGVDKEETVDGIEVIMEPGGDMMEGETGDEAGAGRIIEGEVGTRMKKGGAEIEMRKGGANRGRGEGAGAEVGREETLKTGQVVGGAGMRKEEEAEEEAGIETGGEEEVMRRDRDAEKRENRSERSR